MPADALKCKECSATYPHEALYAEHGELRERISDGDGGLRRFVNVYLRGEDIRFLDGLDTEVGESDEVTILPAVAGG